MTDEQVAKRWPQVPALEAALQKLSEGTTVPIRLRPDADRSTQHREVVKHLRSQMYLEGQ